uniref:Uncharacterized protein n=1 Tax=Oryza brachyantha TaxID=4533 RepID=J3N214_ORYBR
MLPNQARYQSKDKHIRLTIPHYLLISSIHKQRCSILLTIAKFCWRTPTSQTELASLCSTRSVPVLECTIDDSTSSDHNNRGGHCLAFHEKSQMTYLQTK